MRLEPDRDSAEWWAGVDRGEILLQRCAGCGVRRFPARAVCNRCRSFDAEWVPALGSGTVYSWIVNHQKFAPDAPVPYTVVCVRLAEGEDILMYGNLLTEDGAQPTAGMPVEAVVTDGLVQWRRPSR